MPREKQTMAELGQTSRKGDNNVYTVLTAVALVALLAGVAYVWYRCSQLTGGFNPFSL